MAIHAGDFAPSTTRQAEAVLAWQRYTDRRFWALWGVLMGAGVVAQVVGILDRGGLVPQLIAVVLYASLLVIWIVVIRVHRRQVAHMAQRALTVLAREHRDLLG